MALTKVSGEVITRPLVLTGNASVSGIMTVGIGSTTTTIDGSQDFPTIRPTLDLNFAATKTLDRRITFTRDSIGTYTDEFGIIQTVPNNVPRFDHDPVTGESLGLLIEEERTNLQANNVSNFNLTNVSRTLNATTAPDGSNDAVSIDGDAGTAVKYSYKTYVTTTTGTYTASIFLKYKSEQNVVVRINDNTGVNDTRQVVNIQNGTLTGSPTNGGTATGATSSIVAYPNGWYRVSVTCTFNDALTQIQAPSVLLTGYTSTSTTNGVYLWGAQLEQASFPTSYIPTSGSTVTRAADNASITGTNFTGFYNGISNSSIFVECFSAYAGEPSSVDQRIVSFRPTSGINSYDLTIRESTNPTLSLRSVINIISSTKTVSPKTLTRIASRLSPDDLVITCDGEVGVTSQYTLTDNFNALDIGRFNQSPGRYLNSTIKKLSYYNKRLTNSQLQSLTRQ